MTAKGQSRMKVIKRLMRDIVVRCNLPRNMTNKLFACLTYSDFLGKLKLSARIPHSYDTRERFWNNLVERIGPNESVLFLEFGVYRGESIRWFSQSFRNPESLFFGFDTFAGLPEDWETRKLPAGTFCCNGQEPAVDDSRIRFVKGLFSDTLPKMIDKIKVAAEGRTVLVHYDADLFSSTLFVLTFLWQWLDRYYFLFDEFFGEESWALSTFIKSYPCQFEFVASDTPPNQSGVPTPARLFGLLEIPGRPFRV